jgi:(2R)-3-sulfolactate dehydrogenase (NADP+)
LLVDVLSSGLTGSNYSYQASSFGSTEGGPTRCGQLIVAFNPQLLGGARFSANLEGMLGAMQQNPTLRLPGDRRLQARIAHDQTIEV